MVNDNFRRYSQAEAVPTRQVLQHPTQPNLFFPVHRRSMRLRDVDYASADCLCFLTFNVDGACGVLLADAYAPIAWTTLMDVLGQSGCTVHACCMMPDHIHLLLAPSGSGETVSDIVCRIKSRICHALRQAGGVYLKWQTSFYDHVLRDQERAEAELQAIVHYIRSNPERAGLDVSYPYRS